MRGTTTADRLVMAGAVVFVAGLGALMLLLALSATHRHVSPLVAGLPLLSPIGFALAFAGLVVQSRARRRS